MIAGTSAAVSSRTFRKCVSTSSNCASQRSSSKITSKSGNRRSPWPTASTLTARKPASASAVRYASGRSFVPPKPW
jgi:hypothetical protein